jgi:hypothetical protein
MGSSSNSGQRAAEAAERERQAQIAGTQRRVNEIFDSPDRAAQRADFGAALRDLFNQDLQRQKGVADRDLKFALARSGQVGGSRQIDAGRTMGEEYQRGVLEAERRAQGGVADLMSRDEQARLQLSSLAQSGTNATAAAQQAAGALRANLESATADARAGGLGDLFGSVAEYKRSSDTAAEKRRADKDYMWSQQKYSPMFGTGRK